ncbi:MAG: hypothetical protein PWQ74_347 [Methanobacteriaceae archaeon]|nr:hypothetical protein [Methanobacteriaceae archaeon]
MNIGLETVLLDDHIILLHVKIDNSWGIKLTRSKDDLFLIQMWIIIGFHMGLSKSI